jgi:hypothetical protein
MSRRVTAGEIKALLLLFTEGKANEGVGGNGDGCARTVVCTVAEAVLCRTRKRRCKAPGGGNRWARGCAAEPEANNAVLEGRSRHGDCRSFILQRGVVRGAQCGGERESVVKDSRTNGLPGGSCLKRDGGQQYEDGVCCHNNASRSDMYNNSKNRCSGSHSEVEATAGQCVNWHEVVM